MGHWDFNHNPFNCFGGFMNTLDELQTKDFTFILGVRSYHKYMSKCEAFQAIEQMKPMLDYMYDDFLKEFTAGWEYGHTEALALEASECPS